MALMEEKIEVLKRVASESKDRQFKKKKKNSVTIKPVAYTCRHWAYHDYITNSDTQAAVTAVQEQQGKKTSQWCQETGTKINLT